MSRSVINPPGLAAPLGPYSYAVAVEGGRLLFVSGCVALDASGNLVGKGDVSRQTEQVMQNLKAVIEAAGGSLADVVKVTNYMRDAREFPKLAAVRARYLVPPYPASTMVEVSRLIHEDMLVEIEAIALIKARGQSTA
jgi:reactive intermediate/imine deaminase